MTLFEVAGGRCCHTSHARLGYIDDAAFSHVESLREFGTAGLIDAIADFNGRIGTRCESLVLEAAIKLEIGEILLHGGHESLVARVSVSTSLFR